MKNSLDEWLLELREIDSTEIMVEYFKGDTNDNKFNFELGRLELFFNSKKFNHEEVKFFLNNWKIKANKAFENGGCNGENWEQDLSPEQEFIVKMVHWNRYTNQGIKNVLEAVINNLKE